MPTQAQLPPTSARAVGVGGATVSLGGADAARQNPAALSREERASLTFGFIRLFGLSELDGRSVDAAVPVGHAILNFELIGFGFEAFSTTELSTAVGATLRGLDVGLRARIVRHRFDRYGSQGQVMLDGGWLHSAGDHLQVGASIRNVGFGTPGVEIALGLSARAGSRLVFAASTVMTRGVPGSLRVGVEVTPIEVLVLRLGASTSPDQTSAGIGLVARPLSIDIAFSLHPRLGLTPVLTLRLVK